MKVDVIPVMYFPPLRNELGPTRWSIRLDGHEVYTPANRLFSFISRELSLAIAYEWQMQRDSVNALSLVLTGMSVTAIDELHSRESLVSNLMQYFQTDGVCFIEKDTDKIYTSSSSPISREEIKVGLLNLDVTKSGRLGVTKSDAAEVFSRLKAESDASIDRHILDQTDLFIMTSQPLSAVQEKVYKPLIDWFEDRYSLSVSQSTNCIAVPQHPAETERKVKQVLFDMSMDQLVALERAAANLASLIIALCCMEGVISVESALKASSLEEQFQRIKWGFVEGEHDVDLLQKVYLLESAFLFYSSKKPEP